MTSYMKIYGPLSVCKTSTGDGSNMDPIWIQYGANPMDQKKTTNEAQLYHKSLQSLKFSGPYDHGWPNGPDHNGIRVAET